MYLLLGQSLGWLASSRYVTVTLYERLLPFISGPTGDQVGTMGKTKITCKKCERDFKPHKHKVGKGTAVAGAAAIGAWYGGSRGILWGPGTGTTGAGVGAALLGSAAALGVKSVTRCPGCDKHQLF
jgi:hypothetical protein